MVLPVCCVSTSASNSIACGISQPEPQTPRPHAGGFILSRVFRQGLRSEIPIPCILSFKEPQNLLILKGPSFWRRLGAALQSLGGFAVDVPALNQTLSRHVGLPNVRGRIPTLAAQGQVDEAVQRTDSVWRPRSIRWSVGFVYPQEAPQLIKGSSSSGPAMIGPTGPWGAVEVAMECRRCLLPLAPVHPWSLLQRSS